MEDLQDATASHVCCMDVARRQATSRSRCPDGTQFQEDGLRDIREVRSGLGERAGTDQSLLGDLKVEKVTMSSTPPSINGKTGGGYAHLIWA